MQTIEEPCPFASRPKPKTKETMMIKDSNPRPRTSGATPGQAGNKGSSIFNQITVHSYWLDEAAPLNIYAVQCLNRLLCWTLRENQRIFRVPLKSDFGQPSHHPWEEFCNFRASRFLNFLSLWRLSRKVVHNLRTCIIPPVLTALHTACGAAFVWALMYYLQPGLSTYLIMPWLKHVQPWTIKPLFFKLVESRYWTSDILLQNTGLKKIHIKTRTKLKSATLKIRSHIKNRGFL